MFFFLSKVLHFLLMPLTWSCILLITGLIIKHKNRKKIFLTSGVMVLIIFSNPFIVNRLMKALEEEPKQFYEVSKHDIGIVLSGIANLHQKPQDRIYFRKGSDRIYHALLLYNKRKIDKILITGGNLDFNDTTGLSEASVLKSFLLNSGVPNEDIYIEPYAKNTRQNAQLTKEFLESRKLMDKKLVLITSAFHMKRSKMCFDKVGLETTTFASDFYSIPELDWQSVLPDSRALNKSSIIMHEVFGIVTYKIMGYI